MTQGTPANSPGRVLRKRWIFAVLLMLVATSAGTFFFQKWRLQQIIGTVPQVFSGPWGDLQVWNIQLEQPLEYVAFDKTTPDGPFWDFGMQTVQSSESILAANGCTTEQVQNLVTSQAPASSGDFVLKPDEKTLLSLDPKTRSNLYLALARNPNNRLQISPYLIPDGDIQRLFSKKFESANLIKELMGKLIYPRNGYIYFSDPEVVLRHLPKAEERTEFLKTLTSLNAVMARLLIKPDSNIDTPAIYWALTMPKVLLKDLRPILEAQKQLKEGGSISISFVLPPIARDHLYTTPLPPENGEKMPDCHWTALTFFNPKPDPRLSDVNFASQFIMENYYEIGKPGLAGDLVLLLNSQNKVVHSSVYLASDIVYTKNGINWGQPWVLMHEKDMVGLFSALEPVKVSYWRLKTF